MKSEAKTREQKWRAKAQKVVKRWSSGKFSSYFPPKARWLWRKWKRESENNSTRMEKSSLNIKSFRNLLSNQNKNYKIAPDSHNKCHQTEVKLNGFNGPIDEPMGSCNIEDLYSIKRNKADGEQDNKSDQKSSADVICGNLVKFFAHYNGSFCLTVLTPVACRYKQFWAQHTATFWSPPIPQNLFIHRQLPVN